MNEVPEKVIKNWFSHWEGHKFDIIECNFCGETHHGQVADEFSIQHLDTCPLKKFYEGDEDE